MATLGDIGWIDEDGYVFLSDRRIDMVVSGGVNIYPAEVEPVLAAHPAVADVAVFGIPDDEMGERCWPWSSSPRAPRPATRSRPSSTPTAAATWPATSARGPGPTATRLPRSEAGKLLKRELREPYWIATGRAI